MGITVQSGWLQVIGNIGENATRPILILLRIPYSSRLSFIDINAKSD